MVRAVVVPQPCFVNGLAVPTFDLVPLIGNGYFQRRAHRSGGHFSSLFMALAASRLRLALQQPSGCTISDPTIAGQLLIMKTD